MSGDTYYNTNTENKNNTPPPSPPAQREQSDAQIAKAFGKMTVGAAQVTAVAVGLAVYGTVKGSIALAKWGAKAYKKHNLNVISVPEKEDMHHGFNHSNHSS